MLRLHAGRKCLDDDHAAAACGARQVEYLRFIGLGRVLFICVDLRRCRNLQQLSGVFDVRYAVAVGKQAVVTDTMEAFRHNMEHEAADELVRRELHRLPAIAIAGAIVLVTECDVVLVRMHEAPVRDRDAMGVT